MSERSRCGAQGFLRGGVLLAAALLSFAAFSMESTEPALRLEPGKKLITVLQTNDLHGQVEPRVHRGRQAGGLDFWAGTVASIRSGIAEKYGEDRAGVLLVDAGDQFQGTLLSNYNEGELVFRSLDQMGYDAVVPGNHDYDFGPVGWLQDRVVPGHPDQDPRGALNRIRRLVRFPLVAANVYVRESLVDPHGYLVDMDQPVEEGGTDPEDRVDWARAVRADFVRPYVIRTVAGVRVAMIGLESSGTPKMTTAENVSDLYFRDPFYAYLDVRAELEGKADIFVLVAHMGNAGVEDDASEMARFMTEYGNSWRRLGAAYGYDTSGARPRSHVVDVVAAGHTHFVHNDRVAGVPVMQSGWGGTMFGRADLVWDPVAGEVVDAQTRGFAGIPMYHDACAGFVREFCDVVAGAGAEPGDVTVAYEGEPVGRNARIQALVRQERMRVATLARRVLGTADGEVWRDRVSENPLANHVTDMMRQMSGVDVAFVNTGGLRREIPAGQVTFERFFEVLPFSNHGVVIGPVGMETLMSLIDRSVKTCGAYSALMQSGLRVTYRRDCSAAENGMDPRAKVLKVERLNGAVIFDLRQGGILEPNARFTVATFDFLADGGSGYDEFQGVPFKRDLGILREALVTHYLAQPARFPSDTDGRWLQVEID
ncbi:MAG: bifunctional metallophosphatase/5'-nucleotidase [Bdellovibrionales bacterium]|nr:bifunctional metallophosphatase/5'-nucleotidase [Bdellovibrionales bacterium]